MGKYALVHRLHILDTRKVSLSFNRRIMKYHWKRFELLINHVVRDTKNEKFRINNLLIDSCSTKYLRIGYVDRAILVCVGDCNDYDNKEQLQHLRNCYDDKEFKMSTINFNIKKYLLGDKDQMIKMITYFNHHDSIFKEDDINKLTYVIEPQYVHKIYSPPYQDLARWISEHKKILTKDEYEFYITRAYKDNMALTEALRALVKPKIIKLIEDIEKYEYSFQICDKNKDLFGKIEDIPYEIWLDVRDANKDFAD